MTHKAYPFTFVGVSTKGADRYLDHTLVYRFQSIKSGHEYEVHIECYVEHLCCVKFFDLATSQAGGRFSQVSGTYEPRTIFRTVADIALDAFRRDPQASFFFVGAADSRDISSFNTRRYRVYTAFVKDLGIDEIFRPSFFARYSMCVLVNTKAVPDINAYIDKILAFIEA